MDHRNNRKVEHAVIACRRDCLGTATPLTYYWLLVQLLNEQPDWSEEEVFDFRRRFVASLLSDGPQSDDG